MSRDPETLIDIIDRCLKTSKLAFRKRSIPNTIRTTKKALLTKDSPQPTGAIVWGRRI